MNLEPLIQTEVSSIEKKQVSYINMYDTYEPSREWTCGHSEGRRGWAN